MLGKTVAVLAAALALSLAACGGDSCEELRLTCDACTDLIVKGQCHAARETALLLPFGANEACMASLDSGDWDACVP